MITTPDRIQLLSKVSHHPDIEELIEPISAKDLTEWITAELGHPDALDSFHPHGSLLSKAFPPRNILHIISSNTPHAAVQNLLRGLLLGSHNIIKLPSNGLILLEKWISQFPPELKNLLQITSTLTTDQWNQAEAIIATGTDDTIAAIQARIQPHQTFIPHGHKISIGIVYSDFENAAPLACRDASLYNQRGCLSPHAIYIKEDGGNNARKFAAMLAEEMEKFAQEDPPSPLTLAEAGAIRNLRETTRFTAANTNTTQLWENPNNTSWTVVYEESPKLRLSCLNRCIYVKPLPTELNLTTLGDHAKHLSTIAIHPFTPAAAKTLTPLPAHRICHLGQSQQPSLFWHHDGFAPLASLVKWKDIG